MKTNKSTLKNKETKAFTLIEMIGVLAVIAILAALLIPKIFEAINNARINNSILSYNTVKTAVMDHYARYGAIDKTANGGAVPAGTAPTGVAAGTPGLNYYDGILLQEGFTDKPFLVKVGTNSYTHVITSAEYNLAGATPATNDTTGATYIIEAVIQGVPALDAKDISDRLDGTQVPLNAPLPPADDVTGRVMYTNSSQTLVIYMTHR